MPFCLLTRCCSKNQGKSGGTGLCRHPALAALQTVPEIVHAGVYDADGKPFAQYQREALDSSPALPSAEAAGHRFEDGHLILFRPMVLDGELIGSLYIKSDLHELYSGLQRYAAAIGVVLVISIFVAFVVLTKLQKVISQPISQLARAVSDLGRGKLATRIDAQSVRRAAHRIEGTLGTVGGIAAAHAANRLEDWARKGELNKAGTALEELQREMERLTPELAALANRDFRSSRIA